MTDKPLSIDSSAINEVLRMARQFKALSDLADVLKDVGQVRQLAAQEHAALGAAKDEREKAERALTTVRDQLAVAEKRQKDLVDQSNAQKRAADDYARDRASIADVALNGARAAADEIKSKADDAVAVARSVLQDLDAKAKTLQASIASKTSEYEELVKRHQVLTQKHSLLSDALKAMQGTL